MFDLKNIQTTADNDPKYYLITDDGLKKAVDMAIWLQKPLLLTGAPGTGKTQLARKVSFELSKLPNDQLKGFPSFSEKPFEFYTKTTCSATDLFYHYDAIGHFQKRYIDQSGGNNPHPYIELNALGKAILQTHGKRAIMENKHLNDLKDLGNFSDLDEDPKSSVVLIDEIDKAPRDFPNDLLNEIERYQFTISELNKQVRRADTNNSLARIIVIMTSNFEKNLPDAFLRRCLFYHIHSPGPEELFNIVCSRMKPYLQISYSNGKGIQSNEEFEKFFQELQPRIRSAVDKFNKLRTNMNDKQPSTSELLEWIKVLEVENFFKEPVDFEKLSDKQKTILRYTMPILAKSKDDLETATK